LSGGRGGLRGLNAALLCVTRAVRRVALRVALRGYRPCLCVYADGPRFMRTPAAWFSDRTFRGVVRGSISSVS